MFGFAWRGLRRRRSRAVALALGVVVATSGFVLLTTGVATSQVQTVGTVQENARSAYDILVRPNGSATAIEEAEGLLQDNYLSGVFGGISVEAYEQIASLPGVEVAAPVANLGYTNIVGTAFVDLSAYADSLPAMFRVDPVYLAANGLAQYSDAPLYLYVTDEPFDDQGSQGVTTVQLEDGQQRWPCWAFNVDPEGAGIAPQRPFLAAGNAFGTAESAFDADARMSLECYSTASPASGTERGRPEGFIGVSIPVSFPVLIAAIDPDQEDALAGVAGSVTDGRYLLQGEEPVVEVVDSVREATIPVLLSTEAFASVDLEIVVNRLDSGSAAILTSLDDADARAWVTSLESSTIGGEQVDLEGVFEGLASADGLSFGSLGTSFFSPVLGNLWTIGNIAYERDGDVLVPDARPAQSDDTWASSSYGFSFDLAVPVDNLAAQVREVSRNGGQTPCTGTCVNVQTSVVGRFDPSAITGFSGLSRVPLETYRSPEVTGADEESRDLLGDVPLAPDRNLGGYLRQPPAVLTTIESIDEILASRADAAEQAAAPISSIRIRVAGVTGIDELSRARVNAVVAQIREALGEGVDVDIMLGTSPAPQLVSLPAGLVGSEPLQVQEYWAKKGVAVQIVEAVDAKTAVLLGLILVVCTLYLAQGALAAVRTRRRELATLLALGWSRPSVVAMVATELAIVGLAGGVGGMAIAWLASIPLGLEVSPTRAAMAIPAAIVITLLAGIVPAWRAGAVPPIEALRPPILAARRTGRIRSIRRLALSGLLRMPSRTALATCPLVFAVTALTALLCITIGFRGQLTGTLLGAVVAADVTTTDYLAVGVSLLLGLVTLVDTLIMSQRERATEYATLAATGWSTGQLVRLSVTEGLAIALVGSLVGAIVGTVLVVSLGATFLTVQSITGMIIGAALAAVLTMAVAAIAMIVPVRSVSRIPPSQVLAEE